jgi:type IV fimbrial biogenesis protein FimT
MKLNRGFTLIELLIAVAILGILMGIAAPSLRTLRMNMLITSQANDLMAALAVTRNEAIRRGVRTGICTSTNGTSCTNSQWNQGWIVFTDTDGNGDIDAGTRPLLMQGAIDGGNTLVSTNHGTTAGGARFVAYGTPGTLAGALANVSFDLCDSRTTASVGSTVADLKGRRISVSATGRAIVQRRTCP